MFNCNYYNYRDVFIPHLSAIMFCLSFFFTKFATK